MNHKKKDFTIVPRFLDEISCGKNFAYRGQSNVAHALVPSVGRHAFGEASIQDINKREREALNDFKKRAAHLQVPSPSCDIEWLALMQHHGCSTRLLDFSTNPLIALFFACKADNDKDGVVFTAKFKRVSCSPTNQEILEESGSFAYFPPHITGRIVGQAGCFVFCGNPKELPLDDSIQKTIIPSEWKYPAMKELKVLGITNSTLFPGLEGICKDINERLADDLLGDWI